MSDAGAPARGDAGRLAAIDVARAIALVGMMATHILTDGEGGLSGLAHDVAGGRASALFAVLAGVGLALVSGGATTTPERVRWARRAVVPRALVIAFLGLTLGSLPTPAAIIFAYYAVLFLCAAPVLRWPARRLALAALAWAILSPVASQLIRMQLPPGPGPNLGWADLGHPATVAQRLLVTGYYPVLTWITYLLAGLAVGRLPLARPATARLLAATGAGLAVLGWLIGELALRLGGPAVAAAGRETFYGTGRTGSWWWLGVRAPHTGEIGDLVHTTGTALLAIGVALLVVPRIGGYARPLAAAGSMTLTLYSLHVIALGAVQALDPADRPPEWPLLITQVALALGVASRWGSPTRRGPVEELVYTAVEATVGRRRPE